MIRRGWRELGFHYATRTDPQRWEFSGSLTGIESFIDLLDEYVSNPYNDMISEHDHYGPYWMKIMTWNSSLEVDDDNIRGTISELTALRDAIATQLRGLSAGQSFTIDRNFREGISVPLVFIAKSTDFDPASLDKHIAPESTLLPPYNYCET